MKKNKNKQVLSSEEPVANILQQKLEEYDYIHKECADLKTIFKEYNMSKRKYKKKIEKEITNPDFKTSSEAIDDINAFNNNPDNYKSYNKFVSRIKKKLKRKWPYN